MARRGCSAHPAIRPALWRAQRRLVEDAALRRAYGLTARREAERHTWEAIFDRLMGWYAGMIQPHEAPLALVSQQ